MITAMIRYSATTVAYVADYGTPCKVDMGNVGLISGYLSSRGERQVRGRRNPQSTQEGSKATNVDSNQECKP